MEAPSTGKMPVPLAALRLRTAWLAAAAVLIATQLAHGAASDFQQLIINRGFCYERAVGDIDGDGRNEVVAVAPQTSPVQGARGLVVFRGPDWKMQPLISFTNYPDGHGFWRCDDLVISDVNADGRPDIVGALGTAAGIGITRLVWWENPGPRASSGAAWKRHNVQAEPAREKNYIKNIQVRDMDGDGRADIVVRIQKRLAVYFQDSADAWTENAWDIEPFEGMAVGKISGGPHPDIIVNGKWYEPPADPRRQRYVPHVYAQKWRDPLPPAKGFQGPGTKIVIVDLNGDGSNDIVVSPAEYGSKYMPVAWYSSRAPKEGPWIEHVIEANVQQAHSLQVADFNGDGRLDVATGGMRPLTNPDKGLWVHLQTADHSFKRVDIQTADTDKGAYSIAVGDLDGDGRPDVVNSRNYEMGPTEIWFNRLPVSGRATRAAVPPRGQSATGGPSAKMAPRALDRWHYIQVDDARTKKFFGLAMDDVTGDGFKDIAAGHWFYRNPGGDMAGKWERSALPEGMDAIAIVDVNGNERGDIIALRPNEQFWLEATDRAGSTWTARKIGSLPLADHKLGSQLYVLAQIVPGGKQELVIAAGGGTWILHIPPNPAPGPWPATQVTAEGTGNGAGDIDGDGWPDIAGSIRGAGEGEILPGSRGARRNDSTVCWWKNPGTAGSTAFTAGGSTGLTAGGGPWKRFDVGFAAGADRFEVGDLNGDGRPDIVVSDERFPGDVPNADLQWYENPGDAQRPWVRHRIVTQMSMNSLDLADIDGDGDLDLVTGEHRARPAGAATFPDRERVQIWVNDGRGHFACRTVDIGKESHLGARVSDLDGDGDLDIVSIAWRNSQYLHVWRNDAVRSR